MDWGDLLWLLMFVATAGFFGIGYDYLKTKINEGRRAIQLLEILAMDVERGLHMVNQTRAAVSDIEKAKTVVLVRFPTRNYELALQSTALDTKTWATIAGPIMLYIVRAEQVNTLIDRFHEYSSRNLATSYGWMSAPAYLDRIGAMCDTDLRSALEVLRKVLSNRTALPVMVGSVPGPPANEPETG